MTITKPIDIVFGSEPEYKKYYDKFYPEAEYSILDPDRNKFNISATTIRKEGPFAHWDMVTPEVRKDFVKKIVIIGTESNGKSTLVQNLASLYQTNYVEEIGRTIYEEMGSYETLPKDFPVIAMRHAMEVINKQKYSNKLLFVDTEAIVTNNFNMSYQGFYDDTVEAIAQWQQYDLVLYLEPDVKWVDDGTRIFGKESVRRDNDLRLKQLLKEHNINYFSIKGDYNQRLIQSMNIIDNFIENAE